MRGGFVFGVPDGLELEGAVPDVEVLTQAAPEIIEDAPTAAGAGQRGVVDDDVDRQHPPRGTFVINGEQQRRL